MKAVIFDLSTLVHKGTATPFADVQTRLRALNEQQIPVAITTNQSTLIELTAIQAPDSVSACARIAANIKEIIQALNLQRAPWFISLGDTHTQDMMNAVDYHAIIKTIKLELNALFPRGHLFISMVIGPAPAMLLTIAQYFKLSPPDCLYVGDSELDQQAAAAIHMPFERVFVTH